MMKRLLSKPWIVVWLLGIAASVAAENTPAKPPQKADSPLFEDPVVATGKGFVIKRSQLDDAVTQFKANLAAQGKSVPQSRRTELEVDLLNRLISMQILVAKASAADLAKARQTMDNMLAELKKRAATEEAFNRQLVAMGISQPQLEQRLLQEAITKAVLDREFDSRITVSKEQIRKYYEENPKEFDRPEMVRASHVLLATKDRLTQAEFSEEQKARKLKEIDRILERARKGEDFAALAKQFSEDPDSRDVGGEYTFGRGQMVKPFEMAAFSLQTNEVSEVVTTPFGYHIIKLHEKLPGRKLPLSEVEDKLRNFLFQQEAQKQLPEYLKLLHLDAEVKILEPKLKGEGRGA